MFAVAFVFVGLNLLFAHSGPEQTFVAPTSAPARRGVAYPVRLLTPCVPAIDFAGSYWAPSGRWTLERPAEPATATLVGPGRVILATRAGQRFSLRPEGRTIRLSRCSSPSP